MGRRLSQYFLFDPSILSRIIKSAGLSSEDTVVEIGPGPGRLTEMLSTSVKEVIAIELDRGLYEDLALRFRDTNVRVVHLDALRFNYSELGRFKVVANIPYHITTPIIFTLLKERLRLESMTLTIQKEVAERIVAKPGGKDYGVLSIMVQYVCEPEYRFTIPAGAFRPVPKVDSACLYMRVLEMPRVKVQSEETFFKAVRTAFTQRRKTLANALRPLSPDIKEILRGIGIDPVRRPETLSIEEFASVADAIGGSAYS